MVGRPPNKTTPATTLQIDGLKFSNCRIFIFRSYRLLETDKESEPDLSKEAHIGLESQPNMRQEQKGLNCQN
jgi:hypothetical protein